MTIQDLIQQGYRGFFTHHITRPVSLFAVIDSQGLYLWDGYQDGPGSCFAVESYCTPDEAQALAERLGFNADWQPSGAPEGGQP